MDKIIAWWFSEFRRAARTIAKKPISDEAAAALQSAFAEQLFDLTAAARRRAWAASIALLESTARRNGLAGALLPDVPGYAPAAVTTTMRESGGPWSSNGLLGMQRNLARHVEQASRQTVQASIGLDDDDLLIAEAEAMDRYERAIEELRDARLMREAEAADELDRIAREKASHAEDIEDSPEGDEPEEDDKTPVRRGKPFGWARMVHQAPGKPVCGFCAMQAARGPVFSSKKAVQASFHNNCRCTAVPVYTSKDYDGKTEADEFAKLYEELAKTDGGESLRTAMDNALRGNRSDEKSAKRANDKVADRKARLEAQRALESDLTELEPNEWAATPEVLEWHEIEFLRRFERRGDRVKWIRKDRDRRSTNDFVWLTKGSEVCELKSTGTKYRTIADHIANAVNKASTHGVTKDIFIVDLGERSLGRKLRNQLRGYNARRPRSAIRELWIMSDNGKQFEQLELR